MDAKYIRCDLVYGFVRLDAVWRVLPDGSLERGCRVRTCDNRPSEREHLASDKTEWGGVRLYFE